MNSCSSHRLTSGDVVDVRCKSEKVNIVLNNAEVEMLQKNHKKKEKSEE
jgi:hypothetical protein